MMTIDEIETFVKERIDYYCMRHQPGLQIAVSTPPMELWDTIPWPDTLFRYGWLDPAQTDGHPSGWAFIYQPEVMATTVAALDVANIERYVDAVLLYVTIYIQSYDAEPDPAERRRLVEDILYDHHPEKLALMSRVQTGGGQ